MSPSRRRKKEQMYFLLFRGCGALVVLVLLVLVGYIVWNGAGALSWDFLTQIPKDNYSAGGIFPAIAGTVILMGLVMVFAVPVGVLTAVYIVEYQSSSLFKGALRLVVHNLAGVPSIVYGLLGLGLLVFMLNMGFSLLASGLTLAMLVLPMVIAASREALQAVPYSVREASLALGTTKWQTVRHHVLPYAMPGVLTGIILSLSRAAGETAPILLTGVIANKVGIPNGLFDSFAALPFHLYYLVTQTRAQYTRDEQYGTALVLLLLVIGMNLFAIYLRKKYRDKYRW